MRCACCNKALSDFESTLRHRHTGEFLNTCTGCLQGLSIPSKGRPDLRHLVREKEAPYVEACFEQYLDCDE